jgi:hypothetical protein
MKFGPPPEESKHLAKLRTNSTNYFDKLFAGSTAVHGTQWATLENGDKIYFLRKYYWNHESAIKNKVIIIDDLGKSKIALEIIAQYKFNDVKETFLYIKDQVPSDKMPHSPKLHIYTNKLHGSTEAIKSVFAKFQPDTFIEIIDESELYKTLFISYGGPDEKIADKINKALKAKGVDTWFFKDDGLPGDKLHRVMSEGVYKHDRTLLVCSENSISRIGVLNEIERMLEREAKEGGAEIIIPVTIDNYIFDNWHPEREDIKNQILSRVVTTIDESNFNNEIERILKVLKR